MIEQKLVEELPVDLRVAVKKAFALIGASGLIREQLRLEDARLLSGNSDESIKGIAKKVKQHRFKTQLLQDFAQLCLTFNEE